MNKDIGRRIQELLELADSLDMENERKNRELCWRSRLPVKPAGLVDESVELVIPPSADAARLLRFMCRVEKSLHDNYDDYAGIMHTVGSCDRGVIITVSLGSIALSSLLEQLGNMPEVERVEEESLARDAFSSRGRKLGVLLNSSISPSKRFCITLKETSMTRPELATVLN